MDKVKELPEYRNRSGVFFDRFDAGEHLVQMLWPDFAENPQGVVLAIPSGGVPVGKIISYRLNLAFDLILVRKVQIPWNPEAGFGAVAYRGQTLLNQKLVDSLGLSEEEIREQIEATRWELEERNTEFRGGSGSTDLAGKTAILVDDGLASGYTVLAAMETLREQGVGKLVLALPTAPLHSLESVAPQADMVYVVQIKERGAFAVAEAYRNWRDLSRQEVMDMLQNPFAQ
ncbi:MAG: phosphoribosyltransferase family protein [Desulfohalobiaceae bacterium]